MRNIPLRPLAGFPNGLVAFVDDEDYERLAVFPWGPRLGRRGAIYAQRTTYYPKMADTPARTVCRQMQRDVLDPGMIAPRWQISDHKNHDTLDNRRENLRWMDPRGSVLNRRLFTNNTSGFRGISFNQKSQRWRAVLGVNYARFISDGHVTAEDAAYAYNQLAIKHNGVDAQLNVLPDGFVAGIAMSARMSGYRAKSKLNTTGFVGVSKKLSTFRAVITIAGKQISRSGFKTAADAARAYNELARSYFGDGATFNIIPGDNE